MPRAGPGELAPALLARARGGATTGGRSGHGGGEQQTECAASCGGVLAERPRHSMTRGPATVAGGRAQGSLAGGGSAGQSGYRQLPSPISLPSSSPHGRRSSSLPIPLPRRRWKMRGAGPDPACVAMAALGSSAGGLPPRRSGTREGFVPLHSAGGPARARAPPLPRWISRRRPPPLLSVLPRRGRLPSVALLPPRRPPAGAEGCSARGWAGLRGGTGAGGAAGAGLLGSARAACSLRRARVPRGRRRRGRRRRRAAHAAARCGGPGGAREARESGASTTRTWPGRRSRPRR